MPDVYCEKMFFELFLKQASYFFISAILTFEIVRSLQTDTEVIEGMNLVKELMELVCIV